MGGDHDRVEGVDLAVAVGDLHARGRLEHRGHLGAGAYVGQAGGDLGDVLTRAAGDGAPLRRAEDLQHAVVLQEGEQVARRVVQRDRRVTGPDARDQRLHEVGPEQRREPAALEERPERLVLVVSSHWSSVSRPAAARHPVEPRDLGQHPEVRRTQRVAPGGEQTPRRPSAPAHSSPVVVRAHRHRHVGLLGLHPELVEEPQQVRVGALVVHDEAGVDGDAVDHVGVRVATQPGVGLVERDPGLTAEHVCGRQPGDPAADDGNLSRRSLAHASASSSSNRAMGWVGGLLRAVLGLDGDPDAGRLEGITLQQQLVVAVRAPHHARPGSSCRSSSCSQSLVGLAGRRGSHVLGEQHCPCPRSWSGRRSRWSRP